MAEQKKKTVRKKKAAESAESSAPQDRSEKYLKNVPDEYCFMCQDGQVFRNIKDLIEGFEKMTDEIFAYHCNENKNDFCCWILDVIGDEKLAEDLKKARNRQEARDISQMSYYDIARLEG